MISVNTKSIRFRILLWYSLTLFLASVLIFSSFYLVTRQILFQQVDKELSTHASKLTEIATRQGVSLHEAMLKQQLYAEFSDIPGMVVVLLDQNGSVVRTSLSSNNPFVSYKYLFEQAQNNVEAIYINQDINNTPMRFIAEPIRAGDNLLGVVLVAHPIDAIQKSLNTLLSTLGILLGVLIFPSILGGQILANKVMRPISHISDTMEEISSEHLEGRVIVPATGDEIEKLGIAFNKLLNRLQESFQRERQFIGDVAHELKTPVATLRGGIELALSKNRTHDEYQLAFSETLVDVNRLSTTIKNILDLAWLGAESANLGDHNFDLSASLVELKDIAVKLATHKHITIAGKIEQNILVRGLEDKISRAILNVIDNAIKYTPKGKTITLSLHQKANQAVVEVRDTGIGISNTELTHIFDRFYRGSKATKTLGSGLGLAIAQGILKAHGGDIKVSSQVGIGTSVTITLPLLTISS